MWNHILQTLKNKRPCYTIGSTKEIEAVAKSDPTHRNPYP